VDILQVLLDHPGLYMGRGVGFEDGVPKPGGWVGRIDVRRLPGGGAVSIDYEATSPQHVLQHAEHTIVGRQRGSATMTIAFSHMPGLVVLLERPDEPGFFTTEGGEGFQMGIRLTSPSAGHLRHAYCHGPEKEWAEFDVAEVELIR
jgi:hypothetical protein